MSDHFENGFNLYRDEPELLLIEVWHRAPAIWSYADQSRFVEGYIIARRQRDQHELEQRPVK